MSIYDQYIKVRKDVILALIEKEPVLHTDSIIGEADKISRFILEGRQVEELNGHVQPSNTESKDLNSNDAD